MTESVQGNRAEVFYGADGWRFRVIATNGEIVAQSEAYSRRIDAVETVADMVGADNVEVVDDELAEEE